MKILDNTNIKPTLTIGMRIQPKNYKIIKQQVIIHSDDKIVAGIYKTEPWGESIYIILCYRQEKKHINVLDYTRFTSNKNNLDFMYDIMLQEIKKYLER